MFVNIVEFPPIAPGREAEFEEWFAWSNSLYEPFEGFVSRRLLKPTGDETGYVGIVEHETRETFMAMHTSETRQRARARVGELFMGSPKPRFYEAVIDSRTAARRV